MNKLRTILTWGLLSAAAHVMGYSLTVSPIEIEAGQSTNLIINLNNTETNLTAYQMKIFLPTGVTVQKKANGKYAYTSNADRLDSDLFTVTVKDAADGSVLIAVFSPDKDVIAGTSGELIRLPIDVASIVTTSLQGSLKEIEFTDVNNQAYNISDVNFTLSIGGTVKEEQTLSLASLPEMTEGDAAYSLPEQTEEGLALTWSIEDATIASINGYQLTPLKAGTTTVTATQEGNSTYLPFTKTFTLTVNEKQVQPEIEVTDISQLENAIYIEPVEARIGDDVQIEICLKNAEAATAYVFDLVLPEGITVAKNDKGKYIDELSDRHDDHTRTFNDKGNNTYSLSTLSGNSEELTGNDGAIRLLTLHVADDVAEGVYAIEIKSAQYSKPDGTLVVLPNTVQAITIEDYVLGDVNGNGGLDIGDAVTIVNHLVGKASSTFVEKAADTNGNGQIDIGDAVTIVNYLVGKPSNLSSSVKVWDDKEPQ